MKLIEVREGDVNVLGIVGEFTQESVPKFETSVEHAFQEQRRDFIIDLTRMTRIDSRGLEALTALQRRCEEDLGMLQICTSDDVARKVFEITRLDRQLTIHGTIEDARAAMV